MTGFSYCRAVSHPHYLALHTPVHITDTTEDSKRKHNSCLLLINTDTHSQILSILLLKEKRLLSLLPVGKRSYQHWTSQLAMSKASQRLLGGNTPTLGFSPLSRARVSPHLADKVVLQCSYLSVFQLHYTEFEAVQCSKRASHAVFIFQWRNWGTEEAYSA